MLVGWLINGVWSVGWPVGPVVWRIGYAFGWLIGLLVCWLADLSLFSELVGGAIDSLFGWLVGCAFEDLQVPNAHQQRYILFFAAAQTSPAAVRSRFD